MCTTNQIRTIAAFLLALSSALFGEVAHALDLRAVARADVIVFAAVSEATPGTVSLRTTAFNGSSIEGANEPCQYYVYTLTDVVAIKGSAGGEIRVIGGPVRDNVFGSSAQGVSPILPAGRPVLVFLQRARSGKFNLSPGNPNVAECEFLSAPSDTELRLEGFGATAWLKLPSRAKALTAHGDSPAYDIVRGLIAAGADISALTLAPPASRILPDDPSDPDQAACREVLGPDPASFYKQEIEGVLASPGSTAERLRRLALAVSWGSPSAPKDIVDLVTSLRTISDRELLAAAKAAAATVRGIGADKAGIERLFANVNPGVRAAFVRGLASPSCQKYAGEILLLLDDNNEEVLRNAMYALAAIFSDGKHFPHMGPDSGFEAGSVNAQMLTYWKSKR